MDFIKELEEARMTRDSNNARVLTYTDCCERAYLSILILEVLRLYPGYRSKAKSYATKTKDQGYDRFRMYSTDLHNFVYYIVGDEDALSKLKDPEGAKARRKTTFFPQLAFNRYISNIMAGNLVGDSQFFLKVESALKIGNATYKGIRRNIQSFNNLDRLEQKQTVTKLLYAARAKLRSSDIIQHLEELAADKNLETGTVKDNEPTVSMVDIADSPNTLAMYRYLVGSKNTMLAKKFVDQAKNGNAIPSSMVNAYMPVIKMVDDIAQAGPAYIQQLRILQNRAQKSRKQ